MLRPLASMPIFPDFLV